MKSKYGSQALAVGLRLVTQTGSESGDAPSAGGKWQPFPGESRFPLGCASTANRDRVGFGAVAQIDQGLTRLLSVGKERTIESFQGFFAVIGDQLALQIQFVCSDMWQPCLDVIRKKCSQALHIMDRFRIVAKMNKASDEVRAGESRKLAQAGHEPLLKKSRWCAPKRKENLTAKQQHRLRDLLRYNLHTVRAYLLKEDFQIFRSSGRYSSLPGPACSRTPGAIKQSQSKP